jgi:hypothetical protein
MGGLSSSRKTLRFRSATEVRIAQALDRAGVLFFQTVRRDLERSENDLIERPTFSFARRGFLKLTANCFTRHRGLRWTPSTGPLDWGGYFVKGLPRFNCLPARLRPGSGRPGTDGEAPRGKTGTRPQAEPRSQLLRIVINQCCISVNTIRNRFLNLWPETRLRPARLTSSSLPAGSPRAATGLLNPTNGTTRLAATGHGPSPLTRSISS